MKKSMSSDEISKVLFPLLGIDRDNCLKAVITFEAGMQVKVDAVMLAEMDLKADVESIDTVLKRFELVEKTDNGHKA